MNKTTKSRLISALITGLLTVTLAVVSASFTTQRRISTTQEKAINNEKAIERIDNDDKTYNAVIKLDDNLNKRMDRLEDKLDNHLETVRNNR